MNTFNDNIMNLTEKEKDQLFRLISTNADILDKIIPGLPLLEYILTGKDTGTNDDRVFQAYSFWKTRN